MEQVCIMLRPIIDHLQQADASVDYTQRSVEQLSGDVSELRCDIARTNKYLTTIRQGLGAQNASHCSLKLGFENTASSVRCMEDDVKQLAGRFLAMRDDVESVTCEVHAVQIKHDDVATHVVENVSLVDDLQKKLEMVVLDTQAFKVLTDDLHHNVARVEREIRELRRDRLSAVPKLEEESVTNGRSEHSSQSCRSGEWSAKKNPLHGKAGSNSGTFNNSGNCDPGSGQSKRTARACSGRLQQFDDSSRHHVSGATIEEASPRSRLPLLTIPGLSRPADVATRMRLS